MSEQSWNRGLDDAVSGAPMKWCDDRDYIEGYRYGSHEDDGPEPPQPEPNYTNEMCAAWGHPPAGADEAGQR